MRIFVEKQFGRWAAGEKIDDGTLVETAKEAFGGDVEADLGGYLFKKRVARDGGGKSGGYRTILCFRRNNSNRIFFLHGFAKSSKGNVSAKEMKALRKIVGSLVALSDEQTKDLKKLGSIRELQGGNDEEK